MEPHACEARVGPRGLSLSPLTHRPRAPSDRHQRVHQKAKELGMPKSVNGKKLGLDQLEELVKEARAAEPELEAEADDVVAQLGEQLSPWASAESAVLGQDLGEHEERVPAKT